MAGSSNTQNSVVYNYGSLWEESLASAIRDTPNILQKIKEFRDFKSQNPLALYGSKDTPLAGVSGSPYSRYLPKARKAHLTPDISIIYELSGKNPTNIKLYGVFTHADLGTGQPANKKRSEQMAKRLAREDIEIFLEKLILS